MSRRALPDPPHSLVANPGGTLEPIQIIGRDPLILRYWEVLERRSLVLAAPRRMGKSSICRRMIAWPPEGFRPHHRDLEGGRRAADLVRWLFDDVSSMLSAWRRTAVRADRLQKLLGGRIEVSGVKLELPGGNWADMLDALLADLDEGAGHARQKVVLFWDEFPLFLRDVDAGGHPEEAMVLLDRLRAARQRHAHLRMVLTGSIGIDEVIGALRRKGYANDPLNDVDRQPVPVLDPPGALVLARALVRGAGSPEADLATLPDVLVGLSEGHPFVLQHLVQEMRYAGEMTEAGAHRQLDRLLDSADDPLELGHYLSRLGTYYGTEEVELARRALDLVATSDAAAGSAILASLHPADPEQVLRVLQNLRRERYIVREGDTWRFAFDFLRVWWRRERGL